jgi:PAS domain S-box-containing protein
MAHLDISSAEWQGTFDTITDMVAILDRDFRIIKANRAMADFLRTSPEDLRGKICYEVIHGRSSPLVACPHERMLKEKRAVTEEISDPHIGISLLVTVSPIMNQQGEIEGSIHVARDISMLKAVQNDLERRNRQMEALNRLSRRAVVNPTVEEVANSALDEIYSVLDPDLALFYIIKNDTLILHALHPETEEHVRGKKKVGECLCGLAAKNGESVYSHNILKDDRCSLNECKEAGMRSFAAIPLNLKDQTLGVLGIASRTERDFSKDHEFLEILAATVATITQNAILFEKLQHQSETLEEEVKKRISELEARNAELERLNKLFVDREFRIKELRDRVKELEKEFR